MQESCHWIRVIPRRPGAPHGQRAGLGTDTLPAAPAIYLPLRGALRSLGVLAVLPRNRRRILLPEQRHLLETFAGQIALAWERAALGEEAASSRIAAETESLRNCLNRHAGDFVAFAATWEVLGELLAHSHTEDRHFRELESDRRVLGCLAQFLSSSFDRPHDRADKELVVADTRFFREPVETLLRSSYQPHHFFHATKYAALTWAEYFTIKFLWWNWWSI